MMDVASNGKTCSKDSYTAPSASIKKQRYDIDASRVFIARKRELMTSITRSANMGVC